jgi:hypothetical protein
MSDVNDLQQPVAELRGVFKTTAVQNSLNLETSPLY